MLQSTDRPDPAVQDAGQFIQSALDALSAHVALLDETGTIIGVNRAWRQYADQNGFHDTAYGIGANYLAVCDTSARRQSRDALLVGKGIRAVMELKTDEFHLEYPCHNRYEKRWYVVRVTRFEWWGRPRYIIAHQDITELKQVQIQLEDSQKRIQVILDTVANGIVTLDVNTCIETANPAADRIFGYGPGELIGRSFNDLLLDPCPLDCMQGSTDYELIGRRKDGSTFPMYFAINEIHFDSGHVYTVVIQDITERKRMETELVEKEKLHIALEKERELREFKSRFLSMMSHEIRTPLTSIRLSHDMLTTYADKTPEEEKQQYLANICSQVEYLTDLVNDVLTISKAEIQQLEFSPQAKDLITYCRAIIEEFQLAYHKTHHLEFTTNCKQLEIMLDKKLMRQALTNLLSNAIKYSPEGGTIRFELLYEDEQAVIHVSDQGIGIPIADLEHLFEPFHRASNVGKLPGTGLGLAITRQAVGLHGGTISATSQPGTSTTFTIRLPVLKAQILTETEDEWD